MSIELAITIGGFFVTIAAVIFAFGQRDAQFAALEARVKEDREKNTDQHKEFYGMKTEVIQISVQFIDLSRRIGAIETDLKEVLNRLPSQQGGG